MKNMRITAIISCVVALPVTVYTLVRMVRYGNLYSQVKEHALMYIMLSLMIYYWSLYLLGNIFEQNTVSGELDDSELFVKKITLSSI